MTSVAEARSRMKQDVATANPRDTVRDAANLLRGRGVGCLPITDRGRVVGIVSIFRPDVPTGPIAPLPSSSS